MFREMRRKTKELSREAAEALLKTARWGVLAVCGDEGYPYAVPVNFIFVPEEGKIYFHGAAAGHKADALRRSDKVCFTVTGEETVRDEAEAWAPYVQSAVLFGRCRPLTDREAALSVLRRLARKYYPAEELIDGEIAASGKAVTLYAIDIEHLAGKEIREK